MTRDRSILVVEKVAALLERLAAVPDSTAPRLAEDLGVPRSTVYRLLATLQELSWVEPGPERGTFRLGLGLLRLGGAVSAQFDERAAARPVLERLRAVTGQTVYLAVRRELSSVCIERLDGHLVESLAIKVGGRLPLHAGAAPRALLAYEPREFWSRYAATAELVRFTDRTPVTAADLLAQLEQVRADGYAVSDGDVTAGIAALGVPVFDHLGAICGALSISGIAPAILGPDREWLQKLLVDAGREVSAALGYEGGSP